MKHFVRFCLLFFLYLASSVSVFSQQTNTGIGDWRVYTPNQNGKSVAVVGNKIYCATDLGFFYYDKEFNNIQTLSKTDGLHDTGISVIKYDSVTATLLVAYQNTNLDLIRGDAIINVNDILRKAIAGEKKINHIYFKDKLAYLSCSFGLVVLDLVKLEIKDTYSFQNTAGSAIKVYASTTLNDKIYIATSNGVMVATNNKNINLSDPKNWTTFPLSAFSPNPASTTDFQFIATYKNVVYAGVNRWGVYKFDGTTWLRTKAITGGFFIKSLNPGRSGLLIANDYNFMVLPAPDVDPVYKVDPLLNKPQETVEDKDGIFWTADFENGLVKTEGKTYTAFVPNSPAYSNTFRILADGKSVVVVAGGYQQAIQNDSEAGFYEFKDGLWENYNYKRYNDPVKYPKVRDLVDAVRNPVNGKLYFASYGFGVIEWNGVGDFKRWGLGNSPLNTSQTGSPDFVRISDLAADEEGNIWAVNPSDFSGLAGLHVLRLNGIWETFNLQNTSEGTSFPNSNFFEKIIIDDNGYKWISIKPRSGNGLVVFDDVKNRFRYLTSSATNGHLPGNTVTALAKDNKGEIWVGTENGIGVFFDPEQVFASGKTISATTPAIGNRALLEGQNVKCIAVDGANRKWVGTETGLWLFNEDGEKVIYNFTTKNSPLPSDRITDIAVNHATGDVFIGTEAGLASFRAGATITSEAVNCANVFPNPVRPGYTGQIAISGIANNGTVKITDITGNLVYETKALGGTAVWNGCDYNGKKVRSGVYLVLSGNTEGGETCISKVAVIE